MKKNTRLISRKQAASLFSVDPTTIRNWEKSGKLRVHSYLNGRPRYSEKDLSALLKPNL